MPTPHNPHVWQGVLFLRKGTVTSTGPRRRGKLLTISHVIPGPYAPAILRFNLTLPVSAAPPVIAISTEIFHPLVTPLTTYTYSTSDSGTDTVSATDTERLPPGGFSLRHGFPEWFGSGKSRASDLLSHEETSRDIDASSSRNQDAAAVVHNHLSHEDSPKYCGAVEIVRVLYYVRSAFDSEAILDKIPQGAAANPNAWHAWQAHRAKKQASAKQEARSGRSDDAASPMVRQQPGGARRPGQWNWEGVWEERVRKGIQASLSQHALYNATAQRDELVCRPNTRTSFACADHVQINFVDVNPELLRQALGWEKQEDSAAANVSA